MHYTARPLRPFPALRRRETQRHSLSACVERSTARERRGRSADRPPFPPIQWLSAFPAAPAERARTPDELSGPRCPASGRRVRARPRARARPARCGPTRSGATPRHATHRDINASCMCVHLYAPPRCARWRQRPVRAPGAHLLLAHCGRAPSYILTFAARGPAGAARRGGLAVIGPCGPRVGGPERWQRASHALRLYVLCMHASIHK